MIRALAVVKWGRHAMSGMGLPILCLLVSTVLPSVCRGRLSYGSLCEFAMGMSGFKLSAFQIA